MKLNQLNLRLRYFDYVFLVKVYLAYLWEIVNIRNYFVLNFEIILSFCDGVLAGYYCKQSKKNIYVYTFFLLIRHNGKYFEWRKKWLKIFNFMSGTNCTRNSDLVNLEFTCTKAWRLRKKRPLVNKVKIFIFDGSDTIFSNTNKYDWKCWRYTWYMIVH